MKDIGFMIVWKLCLINIRLGFTVVIPRGGAAAVLFAVTCQRGSNDLK